MAPNTIELEKERAELQAAIDGLKASLIRKLKKEYKEKRILYNDPYEIDPYKAMKAELKPTYDRSKEVGFNPKFKPYPYQDNFPIIREVDFGENLVIKEWLVRSYEQVQREIDDDVEVILHLEDIETGKEKNTLYLSWPDALEVLHRRCFTYGK